jgi:antitoxin (DNA-binding transcriptional repressor) of toxin-antitoxin stability system
MPATKVGIREFRENLASYLESRKPVAITRHGATIGIFIPTRPRPTQADLEAYRVASEKVQEMIAAAGTNEEELVEDFKRLRRERRARRAAASSTPDSA